MDAGLALVTRDGDGLALVVIVDRFGVLVVAETGEPLGVELVAIVREPAVLCAA